MYVLQKNGLFQQQYVTQSEYYVIMKFKYITNAM